MASRRNLKKNVNYISDMVAGLCIVESINAQDDKAKMLSDLFYETIELRKDIISRISHTEPGNVKGFYKKLKSDFNEKIDAIFQKMQETVK